ncbi:tetratricopeptide repeat protein [Lentzea tibetensis]|uniref:Tetratricopeptide repeat protein n=1 Tax=Lentzea tibetensis TaxID=2591470 RepID=A0A563EKX3_9PSEU|nr:BTAD domain-containing putative transcriptional regulator [Lentzea tibetensis]TWP47594.1 tetratricopeptide repeat protein [Lentzea tibetensis]
MRFGILGPLEVWDDGRPVAVGGPQQRALLAVLLLNANHVVSADRLMSELWSDEPPPAARRLLQGCVVRLRRALAGERQPLVTRPPGYLLEVRPGELDADRFDELVADAEPLLGKHSAGALEQAAVLLADALALWRGPALDGIGTDTCQTHARRWDERRQAVLEDRVDVDLLRGRHAELVGELRAHVRAHPLRERPWAQLMLALHGADRQADALAAYRELRATLVDQLGVEPNATLRGIESAILAGGDAMEAYRSAHDAAAPIAPAQLPAMVAAFTGRDEHLEELDARLRDPSPVVTLIDGMAGVGKTALAVRWAHRVRERFPDGQLYLNLRGFAPCRPVSPIEALTGFLRALGVPARQLPLDADQAACQYRSLLADRRMLVLLDNAATAEQVRPLLPAGPGCLVLVTSRDRLSGLVARDGARRLTLGVLTPDEAMTLLEQVVGTRRVRAEREPATELGRACGWLPLALRIAAAAVTDAPHRPIAWYVTTLTGADRLSSLAVDGDEQTGVRATFDLSCAALAPQARRMFCLLGLVPGPEVTVESAAAIAGTTIGDARLLLHRLTAAHLVEEHTAGRYAFHDLLRAYAAERAEACLPAAERRATLQRLHDWYLVTADRAAHQLYPEKLRVPLPAIDTAALPVTSFADDSAAVRWLDAERACLVAAIRHAAAHGPLVNAWQLADALRGYFWGCGHRADWMTTAEAGLAAAEATGDRQAMACAYFGLADAYRCRNVYPRAVELYTRSIALSGQTGWLEGEAAALGNLGVTHWEMGCLERAAEHFTRAAEIDQRHGWRAGYASKLSNLGLTYRQLGRFERAEELFTRALAMDRELGMHASEGVDLVHIGLVACLRGRLDTALALHTEGLAIQRALGNRHLEGATLRQLAVVHRDAGRYADALDAARAALPLTRETGNRLLEAIALATAATIHDHLGQHEQAVEQATRALRIGRHIGAPDPQIEAMIGLAVAHGHLRSFDSAVCHAEQAVAMACQHGYLLLKGQALTALARLRLALNRVDEAIHDARLALAIHRETGHRLGEARTLVVLGKADPATACARFRDALDLFADIGAPETAEVRALLTQRTRSPR